MEDFLSEHFSRKRLGTYGDKRILTFILAGGRGQRLYPLTRDRSKPAVPFGANYRIIDIVLSNCVNSGLQNIFLLTQTKSQSLDIHIRRGWNISSPFSGGFLLPIPAQQQMGEQWYLGSADAIYQNLRVLEDYRPDQILILSADHVYRMDYRQMIDFHNDNGAAVTLPVMSIPKKEAFGFGVLTTNGEGQINGFVEKPKRVEEIPGEGDHCMINMGIYLFETQALVRQLVADVKNPKSDHDFGKNILPAMVKESRMMAMPFSENRLGGYWRDIGTIESFYQSHMDLLEGPTQNWLDDMEWPMYPVGERFHASHFIGGAQVDNSLVASGCRLSGCTVHRSILFPKVVVEEGAIVEDSILFHGCVIEKGAHIRGAVLDKFCHIGPGKKVGLDPKLDQKRFTVTETGIPVVPKNFTL